MPEGARRINKESDLPSGDQSGMWIAASARACGNATAPCGAGRTRMTDSWEPDAAREDHATEATWLEARQRGLGGFDAPVVMGVDEYRSRLGLYLEKAGLIEPAPLADPEAAEWGKRLEDDILAWYSERAAGQVVIPSPFTIYRSRSVPFASATFDALVVGDPRGLGVVNAKTASAFTADRWSKDPPLAFQVQLAHEMLVAGATWGAIPVLIGGQRAQVFELERDDVFLGLLIEREQEFWLRVVHRDPPEEQDPAAMRAVLRRMFPRHEPSKSVALSALADHVDTERTAAIEMIKAGERAKLESENLLIEAMKDAEIGVLPSGVWYSWRVEERKAHTVPASAPRVLRRHNPKIGDDGWPATRNSKP